MNLHAIVHGAIGAVNPHVPATLQASAGYKTDATGRQVPSYQPCVPVMAQRQDLATRDLRQLDGLNITGSTNKIYLYGMANSVVRVNRLGGDLITFTQDGSVYLTTAVLEQWPDWVAVSATLQNGS